MQLSRIAIVAESVSSPVPLEAVDLKDYRLPAFGKFCSVVELRVTDRRDGTTFKRRRRRGRRASQRARPAIALRPDRLGGEPNDEYGEDDNAHPRRSGQP